MATIQTNFLFNSHVRPAWAGPITISDNKPMGLNSVYDPANIPQQPPNAAAFLTVAPYPEVDQATGEPLQYTGSIVRVILTGGGGYYPDTRTNPGIILIRPNDPWRG